MDENSISIINRSNKEVIGERASALPVKLMTSLSWVQYILIGFVIAFLAALYFVWTVQKQVVVVEVSGKSPDFQVFEIK